MVERLGDAVSFYKIGLQLLAIGGMDWPRPERRGRQLFLDWKLHDIGATVEKATAAIAAAEACDLITVHAEPQVLAAAVRGGPVLAGQDLGVTVLTSLSGGRTWAKSATALASATWSSGAFIMRSTRDWTAWSPARSRRRWRARSAGRTSWW